MIAYTKHGHKTVARDAAGNEAMVIEPYTHVLYKTSSGGGGLIEVSEAEATIAVEELHAAVMANPLRPSFIVFHPLDQDGSEYIFAGTIIELRRITTAAANALKAAAQAIENENKAQSETEAAAQRAIANIAASRAGNSGGLVVPRR